MIWCRTMWCLWTVSITNRYHNVRLQSRRPQVAPAIPIIGSCCLYLDRSGPSVFHNRVCSLQGLLLPCLGTCIALSGSVSGSHRISSMIWASLVRWYPLGCTWNYQPVWSLTLQLEAGWQKQQTFLSMSLEELYRIIVYIMLCLCRGTDIQSAGPRL